MREASKILSRSRTAHDRKMRTGTSTLRSGGVPTRGKPRSNLDRPENRTYTPLLKPVNSSRAGRDEEFTIGDGEAVGGAVDGEDFEHVAGGGVNGDDLFFSADIECGAAEDHGDWLARSSP